MNASAWQRTIATAHGMLHGLFPTLNNNTANVPVFTNSFEFDYTLYNYDYKCPNFDADWLAYQQTTEWKTNVQKYSNLTSYLTSINKPKSSYTLEGIYSIWEVYNTIKRYPETGLRGFAPIDDYTKDYFGNTFLAAVRYRMNMHINKDIVFGKKLAMSFAHYPNILFTLASLGYTGPVTKKIPGYNSALVFELYNRTNNPSFPSNWGVKVRYYEGNKQWVYHNSLVDGYPIALGSCVEGQECEIDFNNFWNTYQVKTLQDWCHDCGSNLWICQGAKVQTICPDCNLIAKENVAQTNEKLLVATLIIVSIILGLIVVILINSQKNKIQIQKAIMCGKPTHEQIPMNVV